MRIAKVLLAVGASAVSASFTGGAKATKSGITPIVTDPAVPLGPHPPLATGAHPPIDIPKTQEDAAQGSTCNKVQFKFPSGTNKNTSRADAVKALYVKVWNDYANACFGQDDYQPVNNTCTNDLFGWGATIVDGIDTAIVMNLTDIVNRQLQFIANIDFHKAVPNNVIDGFDGVIRYLAGLLSAYDLLSSDYVPQGTYPQGLVDALLSQARILSQVLQVQFQTESGLPAANINLTNNTPLQSTAQSPLNNKTYNATNTAVAGTIILEASRLADLLGEDNFLVAAQQAESYLLSPYPEPIYPGLVGTTIDTDTGNYLTFDFGWRAGIDSYIEYLIKTYYYNPNSQYANAYKNQWQTIVLSTIENIALHPFNRQQLTYISQGDASGHLEWEQDDYACFGGGNLLLGGKLLGNADAYNLGLALTDSCHATYNTSKTGLGPLSWGWYNNSNLAYDPSWNSNLTYRDEAAAMGFFILDPFYGAFPESIESIFYAYRITGDTRWQTYNWQIFQALLRNGTYPQDYADINDINQPGSYDNYLPSFYFAEVLKYLFLTFTDPSVISLDEWVFNTECHPFKRNAGC